MRGNYERLVKPLLGIEGGEANRPKKADPGGLTNKGITWKTYNAYRDSKGLERRSVKLIEDHEVLEIYKGQFWDLVRGDDLPSGLDWAVFDFAVNSGPGTAVKHLQRVLGCNVDGIVGYATLHAVEIADTIKTIEHLCDARLRFMKSLKNWKYNPGWPIRVAEVRASAIKMASAPKITKAVLPSPTSPNVPASASAKAPEAAQAQLKTAKGAGFGLGSCGAAGQTLLNQADNLKPHFNETFLGRFAFAAFAVALVVGGILIGYNYLKEIKEKGGLGGFIGSVFK